MPAGWRATAAPIRQAARRRIGGARGVGGADREAVDVGTIERRYVDRRHNIFSQRGAERFGQHPRLAGNGARKQRRFETRDLSSTCDASIRPRVPAARSAHARTIAVPRAIPEETAMPLNMPALRDA